MIIHQLEIYLALLLIACLVAIAVNKWIKAPYTIALVLVGLVIAFLKLAPGVVISKDLIFSLILPPLLFYGAFELDLEDLKKNWASIAALAIPGVIVSTLLVGYLLHWWWGVSLLVGLLFGALVSPTDPVSVISVCRQVNAPKRLRVVLEGESLFNDGTGIVVFGMIFGLFMTQEAFNLTTMAGEFIKVALGGALIGAVLGYIAYRILAITKDHLVEVTLTVVLAFGASLVAETLHVSGIIATVVAGLIIGNYGRIFSMSSKSREALEHFWEAINFIVNSVLFLLIGLELQALSMWQVRQMWIQVVLAIIALQLARILVAYPVVWIQRKLRPHPIPFSWAHVFFWGGLKGSIPIALVVGLPKDFPYREIFLTAAFGVVLVSLLIQGLTMKILLKRLGLAHE